MPSGVISHQSPGLFLKIKFPNKFDGTALCISTLVPDLDILIDYFLPFSFRSITHSLLGLLIYTIPLTILLTILFRTYIGPFVANIAKRDRKIYQPLRYFGLDDWDKLKEKRYNKRYFIVASYSALIGGLTHILLDVPSHHHIELFFPIVMQSPDILLYSIVDFGPFFIGPLQFDRNLTVARLIWIIEDTILLIISLYLFRYIKKYNLIYKWYNEA
ncbi:MAG: DUF4184 family protein [Promethearchaeota archaeon]